MAKPIRTEALLQLYEELGTCKAVAEHINSDYDYYGFQISERTVQHRLKPSLNGIQCGTTDINQELEDIFEEEKPIAGGVIVAPDKRRHILKGKRYVFTAVQNNTYVHEGFFESLLTYCRWNDAQLVVSKFTYNKSGFQNGTKADEKLWYDPRVEEYAMDCSVQVAKGLVFCGELDVLPTAVDPLSGLENYAQNNSAIVPHTKVQMKSLPRMTGEDPRFLYTTGALTQRNYIQRKAGQKAEFHHVFGALAVEINDEGEWFARQLIASEDGSFYDLKNKYTPLDVKTGCTVDTIVWGDIHVEKLDYEVKFGAWEAGDSIFNTLKPKIQFIHDLTDFTARNHHNLKDPFFWTEKLRTGTDSVRADLVASAVFLRDITKDCRTVVVESNHDQALVRWLKEADVRRDPENAEYFHEASYLMHKNIRLGNDKFNIYEHTLRSTGMLCGLVEFLREDDSYVIHEVEHGLHGHRGPNGARGNPRAFKCIGRKVTVGHMHSAGIVDGVYVAGVSGKLDMGYNKGPSSWSHSHVVMYPNGKRAIITMRGSKWRA